METFNYLLAIIQEQISTALFDLIGSIILGGIVGLGLGVVFIVVARRKELLKRNNAFWSFIAALNYVYIPTLLLVLGGFLGTVRGVHKISGNFINTSTQPIVQYAQGYLPQIQDFVNVKLDVQRGQNIQLEDLIAQQLAGEIGLTKNSYEYQAMFKINSAILSTVLMVKGPDCIGTIKNMDVTNMPSDVFNILPDALHEVCDGFFFFKYLMVLSMVFPLFMVSIVEYMLFRLSGKITKTDIKLSPFSNNNIDSTMLTSEYV